MNKFQNPKIKTLLQKYELISSLNQLLSLSGWDLETYMPSDGASYRGQAVAKVSTLLQKLYLDKEFIKLVEEADKQKDLTDYEKGVTRLLKRNLYSFFKLPPAFIEKFALLTSQSQVAWREAKEKNDYSIFEPYLDKVIDLTIERAKHLEYEDDPYDALIDEYEEDLTTADVEKYFASIKPTLVETLDYVKSSKKYSPKTHPLEREIYDKNEMENLNYKILEFLKYDPNILRLDVSSHPFSQSINSRDARITTRYLGNDFAATTSSTIHEFGHALYDMQVDDDMNFTPVGNNVSLVIHESQSRFWENIIGRNMEFLRIFAPKFKKLGDNFKNYSIRDHFRYLNKVKPSLIRVEADEITYHFHIMIRFEIEKMMVNKEVKAKDLPELWNSKYKEYLGIKPKNNREGVLQDIHWSMGAIGYFPTYSMGTILSSFWKEKIEAKYGSIDELIKDPVGIKKIKEWLRKNIHQYGSTYTVKDLLKKKFNTEYSAEPWKRYINGKYREIY